MTAQPTHIQATMIRQVRSQLGVFYPLAFMIDGDRKITVNLARRKRCVEITYDMASDLYDVRVVDLSRSGLAIRSEHTYRGIYADSLGELLIAPRERVRA